MFEMNLIIIMITCIVGGGFVVAASASSDGHFCKHSRSNQCPEGEKFGYPFYMGAGESGNSTDNCGYRGFEISCSPSNGRPVINISHSLYYVWNMDSDIQQFTLLDVKVDEEDCPRPTHNFTLQTTSAIAPNYGRKVIYFYNCSSGYPENALQRLPCLDAYYNTSDTTTGLRSFAFPEDEDLGNDGYDWFKNCQGTVVVPVNNLYNSSNFRLDLKSGFTLIWNTPSDCSDCEMSGGHCLYNQTDGAPPLCSCKNDTKLYHGTCPSSKGISVGLKITTGVCAGISGVLLVILLIYRKKCSLFCRLSISGLKAKIKTPTNVEVFLESVECFGLQRYSYSEIKEMTNFFIKPLGQGGFGSVFKGKLSDGRLVAIKVLNESNGDGEDFINEVATIGRTNHVNVVGLLGFCSSGTKRALVYEFMPNGSLEKFIYDGKNKSMIKPFLGWEKLYQIILGIARGLEYLHRGCNTRILHFDIKPHNILLDEDFCPKISDFGLAKLCVAKESVLSMHVARGTMGYIAPEVCFRNFGKVSHKSDVYSYGIMTLEMIGGRKNIDPTIENANAVYFPEWIYNHLKEDFSMEEFKGSYKEETAKKMIIVSLWCIQTRPSDRPSISKVVEMLEGNLDDLQMPPDPFQSSPRESTSLSLFCESSSQSLFCESSSQSLCNK